MKTPFVVEVSFRSSARDSSSSGFDIQFGGISRFAPLNLSRINNKHCQATSDEMWVLLDYEYINI